ncbi:hypothetical protein F53441_13051 [Fusarium austroafricanum]|uniref:Cytochrome P450 monooxygenase n=1 Tax=Fusarium austroafricanum TaxID=2364996 RepID=A0A8H4NT32_9HYPO|nr:hypothetical protein F53441_13051 [Fusarium austroafricanum]
MHRKLLQKLLSNTNVRQWHNLQIVEARRTVRNMIKKPETWETSLRRLAVAIVLQVSYGTEVLKDDDPYIQIANDAMYATGNGGVPANSIVDLVPFVRYLPGCIVRDWSLRFARKWRWAIKRLHDILIAAAQAEYGDHHENGSLVYKLLREYNNSESHGQEQEWSLDDIKGAAGAVFIAGADTTWATCMIFILNMILHPEIQEKAQKELHMVIGSDRLPNFSDRPSLPYIEHIVQEIYRTVIYANAYAMAHDERDYKYPLEFNPERYDAGEQFPVGNFGFGRRVCVGRHLADNSVWIMVATMLSILQFCKKMSSTGTPIEPQFRFTNGGTWSVEPSFPVLSDFHKPSTLNIQPCLARWMHALNNVVDKLLTILVISHPEHFDYAIKLRSRKAAALVGANLV